MEGSSGKIVPTDNPNIVKKIIFSKKTKTRSINTHRASTQYRIQNICYNIIKNGNYKKIFVPNVYSFDRNSYTMDKIDTQKEVNVNCCIDELKQFYKDCKKYNLYPVDFELYLQKDGKIALIDFDKFAIFINENTIEYPWGERLVNVI
jgi:hypothetical protein